VVLVPRWLRHPHATPQPAEMHEEEPQPARRPAPEARQAPAAPAGYGQGVVPPDRPHHPGAGPDRHRAPAPASLSPAARRARILRARRRTMSTLILLAAGAAGLAVAHLAAWWVTIAPGVMVAGFLLLLREAASIDEQRATARTHAASQRRAEAPARRPAAGAPAAEAGEDGEQPTAAGAGAEVIDISARIGDQLYDQYTDAQARAIGD